MYIALWIVASVLAAAALAGGAQKLIQPREKLAASGLKWVEDFSPGTVKVIGVVEVLAAIGLVLPAVLDFAPVFVPLAAVGLVLLMVGAMITHVRRHEANLIGVNLAVFAIAAFVAWGRFGPQPFNG